MAINGTESAETSALLAENEELKQKIHDLETKLFLAQANKIINQGESQIDPKIGIHNIHYGRQTLESYIDMARRGNEKTNSPRREAVSVIFLRADHYAREKKALSHNRALKYLRDFAGVIDKFISSPQCRTGDRFAKASYQDDEFLLILPETDKPGAQKLLNKVITALKNRYAGPVSLSYGIANYAADIVESSKREPARQIASKLVDIAKKEERTNKSPFAGKIEYKFNIK